MTWNSATAGAGLIDCRNDAGDKLFYVGKDGRMGMQTISPVNCTFQVGYRQDNWSGKVKIHVDDPHDNLLTPAIHTDGAIRIIRSQNVNEFANWVMIEDTDVNSILGTRCYSITNAGGGNFNIWGDGQLTWNNASPSRQSMIDCQDLAGNKLFYVGKDGKVGIGTNTPLDAKLTVDGTICMKEGWVRLSGAPCWTDYVFEQGYIVPSLDSVEQYVRTHKHLPEVPTAKEVEANGFMIGETQRAMLKNMEEMYLQMIELNKRVKTLELVPFLVENIVGHMWDCL